MTKVGEDLRIHLFILNSAVIASQAGALSQEIASGRDVRFGDDVGPYVKQFDLENQRNAAKMATYYELFYMLENDIRSLIEDTLETLHGEDWWSNIPQGVRDEAERNQNRELQSAVTPRSDRPIDYINFGQLWDIIQAEWQAFAGMFSDQKAVSRVLSGLNNLRGPIAHCGVLAEDEVDRLRLTIKDWFRVLEGPKA